MVPTPPPLSARIQRLLDQQDLANLILAIRDSSKPELRAQAAWALGELHDMEAVESLARSILEDPDPSVQVAARQAMQTLLGAGANLALSTYRQAAHEDAWLVDAPDESFPGEEYPEISEDDLSGLILVARHESDLNLRLKAIRRLAHSSDIRATDALAELALDGDSSALRDAARRAIEGLYGENADAILENYRGSAEPAENELDEDEEMDQGPLSPEMQESNAEDLDEELDEDDWDDDADDELGEDEKDELAEIFPKEDKNPKPSPYPFTLDKQPTRPVVEDLGISWRSIAWILFLLVLFFAIFLFLRP